MQGVTPLHIAVVNQNITLVGQLIARGGDVATPRVTGLYFKKRPGGLVYYDEHILSFAACMGNEYIMTMLMDAGASTRVQDSRGNTVLHILVMQPNKTNACQAMDLILSRDVELDHSLPWTWCPTTRSSPPSNWLPRRATLCYATYEDSLWLVGEILSVLGAILILLLEVSQLKLTRPLCFCFRISYACLVVLLCVARASELGGEDVLMALCLVLGWSNVMFFARGFEMLGPYVIMIQKVWNIFGDLTKFMWLSFIVLIGCLVAAAALWMVYMTLDPESIPAYRSFPITLFSQFECGDTHWRVAQERDELWRTQVVATTLMLERRLPRCLWKNKVNIQHIKK
uniref:Transient receptor potential cation channel, subfamily V, member 6 n=1 Tax=Gadus morhua TaxID=8049 RepID=A0A8C5CE01_GADMO